ncbi:MAG: PilZ domain-containing protein [Eubacterium sp.]|nr:PilZ domain-containing protein [Eubacterium sp.]
MVDMRRERRWPASLQLEISSLFKQDNEKIENVDAPIEVVDVSHAGIGFRTESVLPVGYYFNARLVFGEKDALNCVVRILRQQNDGDGYLYGCEIVGAASIMDYVINDYAATISD